MVAGARDDRLRDSCIDNGPHDPRPSRRRHGRAWSSWWHLRRRRGAVLFAPDGSPVATWWPAAGLSVALLALAPRRRGAVLVAAGIVVVSAAANLTGGAGLPVSCCFGVANTGEAVVAGLILKRRAERPPRLASLDDFCAWLVAAALAGGS